MAGAILNPALTPGWVAFASTARPSWTKRHSRGGTDVDIAFLLILAALYAVTHWIIWAIARLGDIE